ncbi:MAG TPA: hypothetical protein VD810_02040 [Methylophilaceae bacterium]|nr:hypothetical protein [Methylophilaceae bacterium]
MTQDQQFSQDHWQLLREIRDGQQKIIEMMSTQQALAEEQVKRSRESVAESVGLQRLALQRQRTITLVAIPAILVCIAAICYLVLRYF